MWRTAEAHSRLSQGVGRGPHVASQTCQYGGHPSLEQGQAEPPTDQCQGEGGLAVSMSAQSARELPSCRRARASVSTPTRGRARKLPSATASAVQGPQIQARPFRCQAHHASCFLLRTATRGSIARVLPDFRWRRMKCASAMESRSYRGERSPVAHSFTGGCSSR